MSAENPIAFPCLLLYNFWFVLIVHLAQTNLQTGDTKKLESDVKSDASRPQEISSAPDKEPTGDTVQSDISSAPDQEPGYETTGEISSAPVNMQQHFVFYG